MARAQAMEATIEEAARLDRDGRRPDAKLALAKALEAGKPARRGMLGGMKKASRPPHYHDVAIRFSELAAATPAPADLDLLERLAAEYADDVPIRVSLAAALCGTGRRAEGVAEYEEIVRANAVDGLTLAALAAEYAILGKRDEAVDRYRRALDHLLHEHKTDRACAVARSIAALSPSSLDDAHRVVELARGGDPSTLPDALERYAILSHAQGKMSQEVAAWKELLGLAPDRAEVRRELASAYTRILDSDSGDRDAWKGLDDVDPGLAAELRVLLMVGDECADEDDIRSA
jgi:tetratricopeptide (TPR) repeat protein